MNARKDENKGKTHADKLSPKPHTRPVALLDGAGTLRIKGHDWDEFMDQRSKTNQTKGIITFDRTDKYLIVNKTQKDQIIEICGSEYIEDWYGKRITLYLREEKIGAEMKMCVRVKKPPKARTAEEGIAELGFTPDYEDTVEPADKEIKTSEVDESKPWHKRVVEATRAKTQEIPVGSAILIELSKKLNKGFNLFNAVWIVSPFRGENLLAVDLSSEG